MSTTSITIEPATQDLTIYISQGVPGSVTLDDAQTLTNKTLTTPKIGTAILDVNGNELLKLTATASAVNELTLANAATGGTPTLTATGDDTNIGINLVPKGSGVVSVGGAQVATVSGTQTLTNKTLTNPVISGSATETTFAITDGASVDINPANGGVQTWTLGASRTPTATSFANGQSVTLMVDDGTAYTITWTTIAVTWVNSSGAAPTLKTSGYTPIVLFKVGGVVYGCA